jgi:predicted class III extradiol MEMO1 family dioxygenase
MDAIASLDPALFNDYLKKTQNTICGRNPICVMLQVYPKCRLKILLLFANKGSRIFSANE